jgi:hypothetical protein
VAGKVDAEKREAGIGNRIDGVADEVAALVLHLVVLAAEGNDLEVGLASGHAGDRVAVQPGAVNDMPRFKRAGCGLNKVRVPVVAQADHLGIKNDFAARVLDKLRVLSGDKLVIYNAGSSDVQGADAVGMRLKLAELVAIQHTQALDAVGNAPIMQLLQSRNLVRLSSHHQFAAFFVRNIVLSAEPLHRRASGDTVSRLE